MLANTPVSDISNPVSSSRWSNRIYSPFLSIAIFVGIIVFGCATYSYLAFHKSSGALTVNAGSVVDNDVLVSIGPLWAQDRYCVDIPVRNSGETELKLVDLSGSCICTTVYPKSLAVPAGSTGIFRAQLDLASYHSRDYQVPTRTTEVGITAFASTGELPLKVSWKIRAEVRNAIGIHPVIVIQAPVVVGAESPSQSVQVVEHVPLRRIIASCDPVKAEVDVEKATGEDQFSKLTIHLKSSETLGTFEFPVVLTPVATDEGTTIPPVKIQVRGHVVEDVYAFPSTLVVGMIRDGDQFEGEFALVSRQRHAFEITKIETSLPSIQAILCESGRSPEMISIRIPSGTFPAGRVNASITITAFDTIAKRQMRIVVPLAGYALPPSEGDDKEARDIGHPDSGIESVFKEIE